MKIYGVYGASGCGRSIMPVARASFPDSELVFVDDAQLPERVNGHRCLRWDEFIEVPATEKWITIAISNSKVREHLADRCASVGIGFFEVRASNVIVMDDVQIGEGAVLSPFVTLTSNIRIGRHFHANLYSYIEHDCLIGDYVTFAPGVHCNGNIVIGDHAYIGAGAVIRQGRPDSPLTIGASAVVGMGAVVTRDVAPGETVVGNPARQIASRK